MSRTLLEDALSRTKRRLRWVGFLVASAWAALLLLAVLTAGAWIDLLLELPSSIRSAILLVACAAAVAALAGTLMFFRKRKAASQLAIEIDRAAGAEGMVRAGVDLMALEAGDATLRQGLANLAIDRAGLAADAVSPVDAIPVRPVKRPAYSLLALASVLLIVALLLPRLASKQWQRFSDPYGDHPPFSWIEFDVDPGDVTVRYRDDLDVAVTTNSKEVDQLELVVFHDAVSSPDVVPMFRTADQEWNARLTSVVDPIRYLVRHRNSRSRHFDISVATVPEFEKVFLRVEAPAYTRLPAYEGPVPEKGIAGLAGTEVFLRVESNRPLESGRISSSQSTIPLDPSDDSEYAVTGSFQITESTLLSLSVTDAEGQAVREPMSIPVQMLVDKPPSVQIIEPKSLSMATPNITLPVVIAADDDFGVSHVSLYRTINDGESSVESVPIDESPVVRFQGSVVLPLSQLGVKPGDVLRLFARADDSDPAGGKGAESEVVTVEIISEEEFSKLLLHKQGMEMLQSKYQQAVRRLEATREEFKRLMKRAEDAKTPEEEAAVREDVKRLQQKMRDEAEAIQKLAEESLELDLDRQLTEELQRLAGKLEDAADQLDQQAQTPEELHKQLEELAETLDQEQSQFEEATTKPLEYMSKMMKVLHDEQRFSDLVRRQRELAQRLASLKDENGNTNPSLQQRMKEASEEQESLRLSLRDVLDRIEEDAIALPENLEDEELAEMTEALRASMFQFVDSVRESGASEEMVEAATGWSEFSGARGYEHADRAATILEKFIEEMQNSGHQCRECAKQRFQPNNPQGKSRDPSRTMDQLLPGQDETSGQNRGKGSGGGYSAQRASMENMGLYGPTPEAAVSSSRSGADSSAVGVASSGRSDVAAMNTAEEMTSSSGEAAGSAEAFVPPRYRQRVSEYLQRLADEARSEK